MLGDFLALPRLLGVVPSFVGLSINPVFPSIVRCWVLPSTGTRVTFLCENLLHLSKSRACSGEGTMACPEDRVCYKVSTWYRHTISTAYSRTLYFPLLLALDSFTNCFVKSSNSFSAFFLSSSARLYLWTSKLQRLFCMYSKLGLRCSPIVNPFLSSFLLNVSLSYLRFRVQWAQNSCEGTMLWTAVTVKVFRHMSKAFLQNTCKWGHGNTPTRHQQLLISFFGSAWANVPRMSQGNDPLAVNALIATNRVAVRN